MAVGEVGIGGRQNYTGSAGEEPSAAESEITVVAGRRSADAVARKIREVGPCWTEAVGDMGGYSHRYSIPRGTAGPRLSAAIDDHLAMSAAADRPR